MEENLIKQENKIIKIKNDLIKAFDENGNNKIDIEDVIIKCIKMPGIRINRENFLRNEFKLKLSEEVIDKAILESPMKANISPEFIDEVADSVIKFERLQVSGISAALSAPGGWAMLATIPADILQYYGYLLRTMQKLMYLYGFPQLDFEYEGDFLDSESMRVVLTCLGVMFGVGTANKLIHKLAPGLAQGIGKKITKTALTKTTIWYKPLKKLFDFFGSKMTKEILKEGVKVAIPIAGLVVGGTITYFTFGPCCNKLKLHLRDTILSNPNYVEPIDNEIDLEDDFVIEVPVEDID